MIPKIIHYCWFGNNPLTKQAKRCIKSWKKYCKEYEIIEWSEKNFNIDEAPLYVKQAYQEKKWAFVADYVRLYAMVRYGGIYMDTDVEVIKPLDCYLGNKAFAGFEDDVNISTCIMACEKGFPLFVELLQYYDNAIFLNKDGSYNLTTNVEIITALCIEKGFKPTGEYQMFKELTIYPKEVFCPKSHIDGIIRKTTHTYAIHHFSASWFSEEEQHNKLQRWKEKKKKARIRKIRTIIKSIGTKVLGEKFYKKIRGAED